MIKKKVEKRMRLGKHIKYHQYGDITYIYDTKTHSVFSMNSIAYDILYSLEKEKSFRELLNDLELIYNKNEIEENADEIKFFVDDLEEKGIIEIKNDLFSDDKMSDIESEMINWCMNSNTMMSALIEVTYYCSEKCRHCYVVNSHENELTTKEIFKLLDDLKEMNVFDITFTGGEPFTRPDIMQILEYATKLGFVIDIFTNGICITDDMIFKIAALYPRTVHFSVYSNNAKIHDYITKVNGSFEKTVDVAKKFIQLGIAVNFKTVVMNENIDDIQGLIDLANDIGATIQIGMSISPKNDCDKSPTLLREKSLEKMTNVYRAMYGHIDDCNKYFGKRNVKSSICGSGITSLSIDPYGNVFPCAALKIKLGNKREKSIYEIRNNSEKLKSWLKNRFEMIEGCQDCEYVDACSFCPGTAMTENGTPFKKYSEACFLAEAKTQAIKNLKKGELK